MSVFISQYTNVLIINGISIKLLSGQHLQAYRHTPDITRKRLSCNAKRAFRHTGTACIAHRNSLSRNAKRRGRHASDRKTVEQRGDNRKTICAKRWCDIPAVARRYMQNSPFHRCPAADRKGGTIPRNVKKRCTYVKSVKRERHRHSRQQYFISTSLPPFPASSPWCQHAGIGMM